MFGVDLIEKVTFIQRLGVDSRVIQISEQTMLLEERPTSTKALR